MTKPVALTVADKEGVKALKVRERNVIKKALKVIEQGALNATTIDDSGAPVTKLEEGQQPLEGKELRIALDMRKPKREAPVYIDVLTRRLESHEKAEAVRTSNTAVSLNIGAINIVQAPVYDVIDVETKE